MPRTKLTEKYSPAAPPIDWLRAVILERCAVLNYNMQDLAKVAGISYDSMRHYMRVSPWEWPQEYRARICRELGVKPVRGVEGMTGEAI